MIQFPQEKPESPEGNFHVSGRGGKLPKMKKPSKKPSLVFGFRNTLDYGKKMSENTRIHGAKASEFQGLERMNKKESRKPKEAETYKKKNRHKKPKLHVARQ